MKPPRWFRAALAALFVHLLTGGPARPDEGLWLFSNPPRHLLHERYGFKLTDAWLDHLRLSALRIPAGGSASFVSRDGLILTNHHVVSRWLPLLGTRERDVVRDGFLARSRRQEIRCPGLEVQVLVGTEDVTRRIQTAVKPDMGLAEAARARRAAINAVESKSSGRDGRSAEVVAFRDGRYELYRYRTYTDVRLVFAPESAVARAFDVCLLRAYEGGKPARVRHYLRCRLARPREGDLLFTAGCPAQTFRHVPVAALEYVAGQYRRYARASARRVRLLDHYRARDPENRDRTEGDYFTGQVRAGMSAEEVRLLRPGSRLLRRKREREDALREAVARDPRLRKAYGGAWLRLEEALDWQGRIARDYWLLESGGAFATRLFPLARSLVRLAEESGKPDGERLPEYAGHLLPALERSLFVPVPIHEDLETELLADSLAAYREEAGPGDELVRKVLAGKGPRERAAELIRGTRLDEVNVRRALLRGGRRAVRASEDPLIVLARLVDPAARAVRAEAADRAGEMTYREWARVAAAERAVRGPDAYPDADGTPRLSFGRVTRFEDADGTPMVLTLGDLYAMLEYPIAADRGALRFAPVPRWERRKGLVRPATPIFFCGNQDAAFGNSGSPVVDRRGELIGVLSNATWDALSLAYEYEAKGSRWIATHAAGIVEVLDQVYDAPELADELTDAD